MTLKTLKDFKVNPKNWAGAMANAGRKYTIDIDELKAEAIKWVKHWRELDEAKCRICNIPTDTDFMHFFNITEEELK